MVVVSARVAMNHLLCGRMKAVDRYGNQHYGRMSGENTWFSGLPNSEDVDVGIFAPNQPCLTSVRNQWAIPFVGLTTSSFFFRPRVANSKPNLRKIASYYGNVCQICGKKCHISDLSLEHVFPKSKGGDLDEFNVLPTCKSCNSKKSDIYPYFDKDGVPLDEKIKRWPIILHVPMHEMLEEWKPFLFKT